MLQNNLSKLDGCNSKVQDMNVGYTSMGKYLNQTGRKMLYSCSWPDYQRIAHYPIDWPLIASKKETPFVSLTFEETCNLWRLYDDIQDSWASVAGIIEFWGSFQGTIAHLAAPGQWNDPDMLIVGDFSLR